MANFDHIPQKSRAVTTFYLYLNKGIVISFSSYFYKGFYHLYSVLSNFSKKKKYFRIYYFFFGILNIKLKILREAYGFAPHPAPPHKKK